MELWNSSPVYRVGEWKRQKGAWKRDVTFFVPNAEEAINLYFDLIMQCLNKTATAYNVSSAS